METKHHEVVSSHHGGSKNKWLQFSSTFRLGLAYCSTISSVKTLSVWWCIPGKYIWGLFMPKPYWNTICSDNPCTSTNSAGRKTQFAGHHLGWPSWPPTTKHKAYHCTSPHKQRRTRLFFSVCFLISSSDSHLAYCVTPSKLCLMSKEHLWVPVVPRTYLNHRIDHVEWNYLFISLGPPQDCLNSSNMGTKQYWSFEPSFYDPPRNLLQL